MNENFGSAGNGLVITLFLLFVVVLLVCVVVVSFLFVVCCCCFVLFCLYRGMGGGYSGSRMDAINSVQVLPVVYVSEMKLGICYGNCDVCLIISQNMSLQL